jgi:GTP pyrophosphokinase
MENSNTLVEFDDILARAGQYLEPADIDALTQAYEYAAEIHGERKRPNGDPYISHPLAVCMILTRMGLDLVTLESGLLHSVLKEPGTEATEQELEKRFGPAVRAIVSGATKITNVKFNSQIAYQAENFRKMLLAMSSDIRVLLVKLADRLHDMQVLDIPQGDRQEFARETLDLYAPLASRLGVDWLKRDLEDLSFSYIHPRRYRDLVERVESSTMDRVTYVNEVKALLSDKLREFGIRDFRILGRPKHLYSIYKKLIAQNIPLEKVYDKVAFRIIVHNVRECYQALGMVHALWQPIDGRFKDFISKPKSNMYQSLHTSVIGPSGEFMEIQIRTEEMDKIAKEGVAAHWAYKEGSAVSSKDARLFQWLKQLISSLQELHDPKEFLDAVKYELYQDEIFVLTPNGEVKELPQGSRPLDFAYLIHTEVGNHCTGAKVNGRIVSLKYKLKNGDVVEIMTATSRHPNRGWLSLVTTSRARSRVRSWLRREEQEKSLKLGREICDRELRALGLSLKKLIKTGHLKEILKKLGVNTLDDLLRNVGSGKITTKRIADLMLPEEVKADRNEEELLLQKKDQEPPRPGTGSQGIVIDGIDDMLVKISRCCMPMPGDDIMGFITAGRGISVHKANCPNLLALDPQRLIAVSWSQSTAIGHQANIRIMAGDRKGLLVEVCNSLSTDDANIVNIDAHAAKDDLAKLNIVVEVKDLHHLSVVLQHLRQINGVIEAGRQ